LRGSSDAKVIRIGRTRHDRDREQLSLKMLPADLEHSRPKRRGDCETCPVCQAWRDTGAARGCGHSDDEAIMRSRPCVYIGCRHSLYIDVTFAGSIKLNAPDVDPDDVSGTSCSLDVAEAGGIVLEALAAPLNVTKERVRQLEASAFRKLEPLLEDLRNE
jgi:hypothetical protein